MTAAEDFLVEIGTEELPPGALPALTEAFAAELVAELDASRLAHGAATAYSSPRRLAVAVDALAASQTDRRVEIKGPPVAVAFGEDGNPGPAALAFARKCGVEVDALERRAGDKGEWLFHTATETGLSAAALLPALVTAVLGRLPVPRPMRWGEGNDAFVRPIHWVVMLHGKATIDGEVLGVRTGNRSRGHRFLAPDEIVIDEPADYAAMLLEQGFVVADPAERLRRVRSAVTEAAQSLGGRAVAGESLYEEVAALVEWPVPVVGSFDRAFLELPREVVVSTLSGHQRYFPVQGPDGELMPRFVTVANIESRDPDRVREGNERVVRPRLADAVFFWDSDRRRSLADRLASLDDVVYQKGLGSMGAKSRRISALAADIADDVGEDRTTAERAGLLAKCDLVTGIVGEFPELQGTMGGYYARASGESSATATAIAEQYLPRYAGDAIPGSGPGCVVSLADRLDTLAGIFALGKRPSGNKDPFGLRRSALGLVRILVEAELDLDLPAAIGRAVSSLPVAAGDSVGAELHDFVIDRLRAYAQDTFGVDTETFEAVRERRPVSLVDFRDRLVAVRSFLDLDSATSLAAANKRISNILRQAGYCDDARPDESMLSENAEKMLFSALESARVEVKPLVARRAYTQALTRLADLREPVDRFFDDVMVMTEDEAIRRNRLSLLAELRNQFLDVADISRLAIT